MQQSADYNALFFYAEIVMKPSSCKRKSPRLLRTWGFYSGAGDMNRTRDLLITNELLYRLSYTGDKL